MRPTSRAVAAVLSAAFLLAPVAHRPHHAQPKPPVVKVVGGHHVATTGAKLYNDTSLFVAFNLEDFVPATSSWTMAFDDGRATLQVRNSAGAWVDQASTSGGENVRRVAAFGPVEPASVAVRIVHKGVASSPRLIEVVPPTP